MWYILNQGFLTDLGIGVNVVEGYTVWYKGDLHDSCIGSFSTCYTLTGSGSASM